MRQHERVTISDRHVQERVNAFHIGPERPAVSHFIYVGGKGDIAFDPVRERPVGQG